MIDSKIYNIDCMLGMKDTPDKFYQLAICDPPYGVNVNQFNIGSRKNILPDKKDGKKWDNAIPDKSYFDELVRVSVNQIIWGAISSDCQRTNIILFGIKVKLCT